LENAKYYREEPSMRILVSPALLAAFFITACGGPSNGHLQPPGPTLSITAPTGILVGGAVSTWSVTIADAPGPFNVRWEFGGGGNPDTVNVPDQTGPVVAATTELRAGDWNLTVFVSGPHISMAAKSLAYSVALPTNHTPSIASAVFTAATDQLAITATDPDPGQLLTITLTPPPGAVAEALVKTGPSPLVMTVSLTSGDLFGGGVTGQAGISVTDGIETVVFPGGVGVTIEPVPQIVPDSLYAIPLATSAAVGEPVTVVVATTALPNPFQYLDSVGLTIEADAHLVGGTFNVGTPGGAAEAADGAWSQVHPGSFMPTNAADFVQPVDIGGGRKRYDLTVIPVDGSDAAMLSGALFNVQFSFSTPGTKTFGFELTDVSSVKRTFYSDGTGTEYSWGSLANATSGIPDAVQVH
jgi:hypothetical protein